MARYICVTCGTQYPDGETPPEHCLICEDERQYINPMGQQWTTLEVLRKDRRNVLTELEPGLTSIRTDPGFAIGQQAYLIQTPEGNVLWDCISFIDDETIQAVNARGGVSAIAVSHPHFYSSIGEWSAAFGGVPVYLHKSDSPHVMNRIPAIRFWSGETQRLNSQVQLIRCGGHFDGSTVLHWSRGADGKGAVFTADTLYVASDSRYVSFMYSYPNYLPLPPSKVRQIASALQPVPFDRLYGGWHGKIMRTGAHEAVQRSAERYIKLITEV